jgi:hypothetical protein
MGKCIDATDLCEKIKWIGLEQDQSGDAARQLRRSLHGDRSAKRVTDEINLAGIDRQSGFDETGLIAKRLRFFGRPWRRLALSEQVHCTDAKPILQIFHQPAPLACPRHAGMHQHDDWTGSARFDKIDVDRHKVGQWSSLCPRSFGRSRCHGLAKWMAAGPLPTAVDCLRGTIRIFLSRYPVEPGHPG